MAIQNTGLPQGWFGPQVILFLCVIQHIQLKHINYIKRNKGCKTSFDPIPYYICALNGWFGLCYGFMSVKITLEIAFLNVLYLTWTFNEIF